MPTMNAISAAELATLRADAQSTLDQVCDIYRATGEAADPYGTQTPARTKIASAVPVGIRQPTAGQVQAYVGLIGTMAVWQVHLPYGQDVAHGDHLIIAAQTLEVRIVLTPQSYSPLLTVIAAEIK